MFAYCLNNPVNQNDALGYMPTNKGILNPNNVPYGDFDSRFIRVHIPAPEWGEMWHYSSSLLESNPEDSDFPIGLLVGTVDASILSATDNGFNIFAAELSYLTMTLHYNRYDLPDVKYLSASLGLGYQNGQIYADALAAILSASHSFNIGPIDVSLSGYAGGVGARGSVGLTGFSFHAAYNVGFGISVSWQS